MDDSHRGRTPIKDFWLAGHSDGTYLKSAPGDTPEATFSVGSLTGDPGQEAAGEQGFPVTSLWWQSYEDAKDKSYPPGFWFSGDATVVFIGCSSRWLAEAFAVDVLREDAHAVGTTALLFIATNEATGKTGASYEAYFGTPHAKRYGDYRSFMRSPGWVQYDSHGKVSDWTLP
jgi:hypothetical protein